MNLPLRRLGPLMLALAMAATPQTSALADPSAAPTPPVPQEVRPDARSPFFTHRSNLLVGEKGEQALDVSVVAPSCGGPVWAFDHAELTIHDARFAHAQLIQIPEPGCITCRPLVVRWYHEPTGRLQFSIEVYRRQIWPECPVAHGELPGSESHPREPFVTEHSS